VRLPEVLLALALLAGTTLPAAAQQPSRQEVEQAVAAVQRNPDLGGVKKEMTLRFKKKDDPEREVPEGSSLKWLVELLRWLSESGRVLMWLLGALLVALVVVGVRRWILVRGGWKPVPRPHLPSHVQSLDIRPETLPDAIGAAALALWQQGQHRAALSLLYRGALSRLVHTYAVPIRAASTEGECVALAGARLDTQRGAFFARLVRAWQLAVYGGRLPDTEQARALCQEFDVHLALQARPGSTA
jgi:hypothetical protein